MGIILEMSLSITALVIGFGFIIGIVNVTRYLRDRSTLHEKTVMLNYKITEADYSLIDGIVANALAEYIVYNVDTTDFIPTSDRTRIVDGVVNAVEQRMSEAVFTKLEMLYNKENIPEIISYKIGLAVTEFIENNNKPRDKK